MEYTQPLREIEEQLKNEGKRIYHDAMTGDECASMFANLERENPNIKELIDRLQSATGNDRYFTMMDHLSFIGMHPPFRFYRSPIKTDDQSYTFDNGMLSMRHGISR